MTLTTDFKSSDLFYDDVNFPRGFKKCGSFSISEADLLTEVGTRLYLLEQGSVSPETPAEQQFAVMCQSGGHAQSKIELLWQKYKRLIKPQPFHSLGGQI